MPTNVVSPASAASSPSLSAQFDRLPKEVLDNVLSYLTIPKEVSLRTLNSEFCHSVDDLRLAPRYHNVDVPLSGRTADYPLERALTMFKPDEIEGGALETLPSYIDEAWDGASAIKLRCTQQELLNYKGPKGEALDLNQALIRHVNWGFVDSALKIVHHKRFDPESGSLAVARALSIAARDNLLSVVEALVDKGMNVNGLVNTYENGDLITEEPYIYSPLNSVIDSIQGGRISPDQVKMLDYLLNHPDIETPTLESALFLSVKKAVLPLVHHLLDTLPEAGREAVGSPYLLTEMLHGSRRHHQVLRMLLANPRVTDDAKADIVMYAAFLFQSDIIREGLDGMENPSAVLRVAKQRATNHHQQRLFPEMSPESVQMISGIQRQHFFSRALSPRAWFTKRGASSA